MDRLEILDGIRKLRAGEVFDNAELAEILESHGCYALMAKMPCGKMNAAVFAAVNSSVIKSRFIECASIFEELNEIPYAVIKGAVLSERIYGSPAMRKSGDIDLLISPDDLDVVKRILKNHGGVQGCVSGDKIIPYTRAELVYQKTYTHQAAAFVKATDNRICPFVNVDVNLDIYWGESKVHADMREFLSHTETTELYNVKFKRLSPVQEFISLCMHHYKDLNSLYLLAGSSINLSLFSDMDGYLVRVKPDAKELRNACDKLGVTGYITFCLWHTNCVFPSEITEEYLKIFPVCEAEDLIERIGLCEDEYKTLRGGISKRLFDDAFAQELDAMLTESDRKKIAVNRKYM